MSADSSDKKKFPSVIKGIKVTIGVDSVCVAPSAVLKVITLRLSKVTENLRFKLLKLSGRNAFMQCTSSMHCFDYNINWTSVTYKYRFNTEHLEVGAYLLAVYDNDRFIGSIKFLYIG